MPRGGGTGLVTSLMFLNEATEGEPVATSRMSPAPELARQKRLVQVSSIEKVSSTGASQKAQSPRDHGEIGVDGPVEGEAQRRS